MKTQNNSLLIPISKTELADLTKEVKETVATVSKHKPLRVADLWNIQRRTRSAVSRRQFVY